jgi:hypothetical protein
MPNPRRIIKAAAARRVSCVDLHGSAKSLYHYDGADASTTITDVKGHATTAIGSAEIDTAQYKFGGSSLLLSADHSYALTDATSVDFSFGTGDFTAECWIRPAAVAGNMMIIGNTHTTTSNNVWRFYLNAGGNISYGTSSAITITTTGVTIVGNTWYHIAVSRVSGTSDVYIDGTSRGSASDGRNFSTTEKFFVGHGVDGDEWNGHIDEVYVIKGTGIYTGNFTVNSSPYCDS